MLTKKYRIKQVGDVFYIQNTVLSLWWENTMEVDWSATQDSLVTYRSIVYFSSLDQAVDWIVAHQQPAIKKPELSPVFHYVSVSASDYEILSVNEVIDYSQLAI